MIVNEPMFVAFLYLAFWSLLVVNVALLAAIVWKFFVKPWLDGRKK